jgi:hypothetical protein
MRMMKKLQFLDKHKDSENVLFEMIGLYICSEWQLFQMMKMLEQQLFHLFDKKNNYFIFHP